MKRAEVDRRQEKEKEGRREEDRWGNGENEPKRGEDNGREKLGGDGSVSATEKATCPSYTKPHPWQLNTEAFRGRTMAASAA